MVMSEFQTDNVSFLALLMAPDDDSVIENPYENHNLLSPQNNYSVLPEFLPTPDLFRNPNTFSDGDHFSALPDLLSLETFAEPPPPPPLKYQKLDQSSSFPPPPPPPQIDDYSLESILHGYLIRKTDEQRISPPPPPPAKRLKETAAHRSCKRVRIRERLFELSKLLPAGYGLKKTNVEMLEEAYKYVKYLQAQVRALESMPTVSPLVVVGEQGGGDGRLGRLTRQQMLQVAVNSAEAQVVMAEKGWCVVSAEQVALFKRIQMRNKVVQHLLSQIPI